MTKREKFYKAYDLPKRFYTEINNGDLDIRFEEVSADSLEELFELYKWYDESPFKNIKDFKDYEEKYPPISYRCEKLLFELVIEWASYRPILHDNANRTIRIYQQGGIVTSICIETADAKGIGEDFQEALLDLLPALKEDYYATIRRTVLDEANS